MATTPIPDIDEAVKLRFAKAFLRSKNHSTAALEVIASPGEALRAAQTLPYDPVVIAEIERLTEQNGEASFLPSKAEIAREIYDRAKNTVDPEDYERLMKLYANIMGYVEKPGANVDVKVQVQSVMVVRDHGTDAEWEARAAEQQRQLVLNASN